MKHCAFALLLVAAPTAAAPAAPTPASYDILAPDAATTLPANAVVFAVSLSGCGDGSTPIVTFDAAAAPFEVLANAETTGPCALRIDLDLVAPGGAGLLTIDPSTTAAGWTLTFGADDDATAPVPDDGDGTAFNIEANASAALQYDVVGNAPAATDDVAVALYTVERSLDDGAFEAVRFIPAAPDQERIAWIDAPSDMAKVCYRVRAHDAAGHDVLVDDGACEDAPASLAGDMASCAGVQAADGGAPASAVCLVVVAAVVRRRRTRRAV